MCVCVFTLVHVSEREPEVNVGYLFNCSAFAVFETVSSWTLNLMNQLDWTAKELHLDSVVLLPWYWAYRRTQRLFTWVPGCELGPHACTCTRQALPPAPVYPFFKSHYKSWEDGSGEGACC